MNGMMQALFLYGQYNQKSCKKVSLRFFSLRLFYYISTVMAKKEKHTDDLIAGFRTIGEAAHHVGKRMTQQTVKSKKAYTRKKKHKNKDDE